MSRTGGGYFGNGALLFPLAVLEGDGPDTSGSDAMQTRSVAPTGGQPTSWDAWGIAPVSPLLVLRLRLVLVGATCPFGDRDRFCLKHDRIG